MIKNFKATLLKRDSNTGVFFGEYCGVFKITCFEELLRKAATIRCYFGKIKIPASERKYKNNHKNHESQKKKKKKKNPIITNTILIYIMFKYCFTTKSSESTKILKVKTRVF